MRRSSHDTLVGEVNTPDVNTLWNASQSAQNAPQSTIDEAHVPSVVPAEILSPASIVAESDAVPIVKKLRHLGRQKGSRNNASKAAKRLAMRLVTEPAYLALLRQRLLDGTLSPSTEQMLWAYAFGRPTHKAEVQTNSSVVISVQRPW